MQEKPRTLALLAPKLVMDDAVLEIVATLDGMYLETKMRKQQYLTPADAEAFFSFLPARQRATYVAAFTLGLSEVLVVERLAGKVVEHLVEKSRSFDAEYGAGMFYCSACEWTAMRDLEFFFPHLDQLPIERTLAVIKPDGIAKGTIAGETLEQAVEREVGDMGLFVVGKRRFAAAQPPLDEAANRELCGLGVGGGPNQAIVMCLEGRGAIGKWSLLCGPVNAGTARERAPQSLRAVWGTDSTSNALHHSASFEDADAEILTFFPDGTRSLQRTLCIVKPHAMSNILLIRAELEAAGFTILKEKECSLTKERAEELYRDRSTTPDFTAMVEEAISGPCAIMALCRLEAVSVLKQLMGPEVVHDARRLCPGSLRAKFGRDGQRNAVHGSESLRGAGREVRFFFPELGADPVPGDDEVRDFLFRKSAAASMDLKTLAESDASTFSVDPTLQQLISKGLMAMCQVQPKGLAAVKWLSRWLAENNPNKKTPGEPGARATGRAGHVFDPPERTKRFIEYGTNPEGMAFAVEPPAPAKKKTIVEVDVEADGPAGDGMDAPPFVVVMLAGPGSGKDVHCARLCKDFNLVHLDIEFLMAEEKNAQTHLGTEIEKFQRAGKQPVPDKDQITLLMNAIAKHKDTNRFLLDGFPRTAAQTLLFEHQVASIGFILYYECPEDTMKARAQAADPGRPPASIDAEIAAFNDMAKATVSFYRSIGKVKKVDARSETEEAYAEMKRFFGCRFVYLLGPPGSPTVQVASKLQEKYGYACIDASALLHGYAQSKERDAAKVKEALASGRPVDASILCPLVLSEVYRDLALGVQNFVLVDFPQTLQQLQFLEHRILTIDSRPMLLDFSRPDADDLAAMTGDASRIGERMDAFFGEQMKDVLTNLPNLTRIPCRLSDVSQGGEAAVVSQVWPKVLDRMMPSLTLVLGLPCSGTTELAQKLAGLTPNTQAVNCDELVDREMERQTDVGVAMRAMIAKGQVVPLSMTVELLKQIVGVTCSTSLVLENCPQDADQIEHLEREFRIDRVFYLNGTAKAVSDWKTAYKAQQRDADAAGKAFAEREQRLEPIVSYYSRLGKLDRIDVNDSQKCNLDNEISDATRPQFAIVTSLSSVEASKQAKLLADQFGVGPPVTPEKMMEFAKTKLNRSLDPDDMGKYFSVLKKYADSVGSNFLVLDQFPKVALRSPTAPAPKDQAEAFLRYFGQPKVVLDIHFESDVVDTVSAEIRALNPDQDPSEIDVDKEEEMIRGYAKEYEELAQYFATACQPVYIKEDWAKLGVSPGDNPADAVDGLGDKKHAELVEKVKERLRPKIYNIIAPVGGVDIPCKFANALGTTASQKFVTIDVRELVAAGPYHSAAIGDKLHKAALISDGGDAVPMPLLKELFQEAIAKSANPMGTFLVTNYITAQSVSQAGPPPRDQFSLLEDVAVFRGIFCASVSEQAFAELVSPDTDEWLRYRDFKERIDKAMKEQFSAQQIFECSIDDAKDLSAVVRKLADSFAVFRDRLESNPSPTEEANARMAMIREEKPEEEDVPPE